MLLSLSLLLLSIKFLTLCTCVDVNECEASTGAPKCPDGQKCVNFHGSYACMHHEKVPKRTCCTEVNIAIYGSGAHFCSAHCNCHKVITVYTLFYYPPTSLGHFAQLWRYPISSDNLTELSALIYEMLVSFIFPSLAMLLWPEMSVTMVCHSIA